MNRFLWITDHFAEASLQYHLTVSSLELNMRYMIRDLFFAGSETTATSIRWSLLHLILYPEIQKRLSKEIEEVGQSTFLLSIYTLTERTFHFRSLSLDPIL